MSDGVGQATRLLEALIRCPSVTPESAGVFDVLEAALRPMGFAIHRMTFEGDGSYPVENMLATRGQGGRHLLFAGHTDVVPPGDRAQWQTDPFDPVIRDGRIFGRGAADMKSGVAAFVAACAGAPESGTISLAITNDEEADSINGTEKLLAWAKAQGHVFDFAIVGEPSALVRLGDSIKVGRRGSLNGKLTVSGTQGHVAYPDKARNPLPVLAQVVLALSGKLDDGNAQFPPSNLEFTSLDVGNETTNVIPGAAHARFNVRFNDGWTPETLEVALREKLDDIANEMEVAIAFEVSGRPSRSFLSPLSGAVETLCKTIETLTGARPDLSTGGGTSDARFVAQYCPVVELGLPGQTMHKANESVAVADVENLSALYAAFMRDYFA
ncbi:MAG TPA: succinyl-diaminopimelate desuccinylase [Devosia sp.]